MTLQLRLPALLFSLLLQTIISPGFAAPSAFFDFKQFLSPETGPYIETLIEFDGESLTYMPSETAGRFKALAEVTILIKQNNQIVDFRKLSIQSPEWPENAQKENFFDIQRFPLSNGNYAFEITIVDAYSEGKESVTLEQQFSVDFLPGLPYISDIYFVQAFAKTDTPSELTRSGYDMLPYVENFFPSEVNQLAFYAELYNADKTFGDSAKFALAYFIENTSTGEIAAGIQKLSRENALRVNPILQVIDISSLPSGKYELVVEMRNRENTTVASRRMAFLRYKIEETEIRSEDLNKLDIANTFVMKFNHRDSLWEHVRSLHPITSTIERGAIESYLSSADLTLLRQYFLAFWEKRDAANPEYAWNKYHEEVRKVQANFGTRIKKGYETDRGRVYLQYGPPNTMVIRHNDTDAYPYEIWHYYRINQFRNKRFVFYNPDLVTNDFELLQSDVPGEVKNDYWVMMILSRNNSLSNTEIRRVDNAASRVLIDLYNNPR
jgi:GWxTD domain-containing protein